MFPFENNKKFFIHFINYLVTGYITDNEIDFKGERFIPSPSYYR